MLAYRAAILLLISYFYGHSTPEQHGKYKIRPDILKKHVLCITCGLFGIGSVRPNYTFALGPFALQVGLFALIIKTYFNEHNGYFKVKYRSNDLKKYGN